MYLQASITNEQDSPSQLAIPSSTSGTKSSTNTEPDTTPQDLSNKRGLFRQRYIDDTETRSSCLSDDNILRLKELSNTRPQVCLRNDFVGLIRHRVDKWRNVNLLSNFLEFGQLGRQFGKEAFEADSGIEGVQNSGMVGMELMRKGRSMVSTMRPDFEVTPYLDCLAPWDVVREVSGVEVAKHRSDGDEQFRTLNFLKDFRVRDGSDVDLEVASEFSVVIERSETYAAVSQVVLIDSGLSHRCSVDWELSLVQEVPEFLLDAVTDGASIDEDDNVAISLLDLPVNALDDGSLDIWAILGWLIIERDVQPCGRDPLICYIGGESEIHWSPLYENNPTSADRVS